MFKVYHKLISFETPAQSKDATWLGEVTCFILQYKPSVIIWMGTNDKNIESDALDFPPKPFQGFPLFQIKQSK